MVTRWVAAAVALVVAGALSPATAEPAARVKVFVEDYASVPDALMASARSVASRIFRDAGIDVEWVSGPRLLLQSEVEPGFSLAIVPSDARCPGRYRAERFEALGAASAAARRATVYFGCIGKLGWSKPVSRPILLGRVMAHEIGHMLLPRWLGHTEDGIMRAHATLRPQASFGFTATQAATIREALARLDRLARPGSHP
jgi:hypothetical protein